MRHFTESGKRARALAFAALAALLSGCASSPDPARPYASPPSAQPLGEVVVAGQAVTADGTRGRYPPGSRMVVRVYDGRGDVNRPAAQQIFENGSGQLPWRYRMLMSGDDFASLRLPAVGAIIVAPDGQIIYRNVDAALLGDSGPDNIPMVRQVPPGPRRR